MSGTGREQTRRCQQNMLRYAIIREAEKWVIIVELTMIMTGALYTKKDKDLFFPGELCSKHRVSSSNIHVTRDGHVAVTISCATYIRK